MLLPQKTGPVTLMRKLGTDGVTEAFVGILDEPAGQQAVVRKLLPFVAKDAARLTAVESRVQDLTAVRHPTLVPVQRLLEVGDERLVIEDYVDAVSAGDVIAWCRRQGRPLPHNVFLHLATQICNGLEALHGRPGKESGEEHVLHLALGPNAVLITREGKLMVGEYGLVRSPTTLPSSGGADAAASRLAHVSPEQTHPDQKLTPASDIFCLGSLLYELLLLEPLFRRESSLQTIHAVRKAEVSGALQRVKKTLPGLDKVLYRALSLNPRHRYQRAFVLREDVRGLMAGFSFTRIADETVEFLSPLFAEHAASNAAADPSTEESQDNTLALLRQATDSEEMPSLRGPAADTLASFVGGAGVPPEDDDLEGLEMWSEVPTTVDPTDPSAAPVASSSVPADQTTWIRRDHGPEGSDFESDVSTDIQATPLPRPEEQDEAPAAAAPPPAPEVPRPSETSGEKRQLSPEELAELGMQVRRTPLPAPPKQASPTPEGLASGMTQALAVEGGTGSADDSPADTPPASDTPEAAPAAAAAADSEAATTRSPADPSATPAPQQAQPDSRSSSYRPKGAPTPTPAPAKRAAPKLEGRKLEGLTFDEDEVTAVQDDEDLEWRPRRGRGLAIAGAFVGVFVAVLLCGGIAVVAGGAASRALTGLGPVASNNGPPLTPAPTPTPSPDPVPITEAAPDAGDGSADPVPLPDAEPDAVTAAATPPAPKPIADRDPIKPARVTPPPTPIASRSEPARDDGSSTLGSAPARSTPPPTRTASVAPTPSRTPSRTATRDPDPPRLSDFGDEGLIDETADTVIQTAPSDLDPLATRASTGRLSAADRLTLEMTETSDPNYTRATTILYVDAKSRGDAQAQRKYMAALFEYPGNRYDPKLLAEAAHLDVNDKNYDRALQRATTAERYWGRLPSELVFSRKVMIYEAQAAAWQGKFYASGGSDMAALGQAIGAWEKYQRHAATKARADLSRIADSQLAKLYDARRRLE